MDALEHDLLHVMRMVDGGLRTSIATDGFDDPGAWGVLLADVLQHLTKALEGRVLCEGKKMSAEEIRQRVLELFYKEVSAPTSEIKRVERGQA